MNRKTKRISVLIAGVLLLAGCSGNGNTGEATSPADTMETTPLKNDFDVNQKIIPYTRDTNSGTREGFMEKIDLKDASKDDSKLKSTIMQATSNGDMLTQLAAQKYSIGYFSFDSKEAAEEKGLKVLDFEGVKASDDSILNGEYKLARNFNYCVASETDQVKKTIVDAFVAFMTTSEGIATIKANGGVVKATTSTKSWSEIKSQFSGIEEDHSKVTINFGGSTSVEKIAKALSSQFSPLAGNFQANHNHTGSGDAYKNTQGSQKGTLDIGFASREFHLSSDEALKEGT